MFIAGPATETHASPYRPRSRLGSTGIAPHAIPMIANAARLNGPMCTSGFHVMCPVSRGVVSPRRSAAHPCVSSCRTIDPITITAHETT